MKILKAVSKIYAIHIIVFLISVFLMVGMFGFAESSPVLFSLITSVLYVLFMYSTAWNVGIKDARNIPGYHPDKFVPLKISVYTAIVPVALLALRVIAPELWNADFPFLKGEVDFFIGGFRIYGMTDFIFRMWYLCFAGLVPSGNIFAYVLQIFALPIVIFVGYFVGIRKFSIFEYLYARLVFSSKDDDKKRENGLRR